MMRCSRYFFQPLSYVLVILNSALLSTSSVSDHDLHQQSVSTSKFGLFNFTELEQTQYDVELLKVPLPESALTNHEREPGPSHVTLISKHGQRYACELPWHPQDEEHGLEKQEEPEMNVTALLLPLRDRPCPIKTLGWWTYEYCHGRFVRQYHMEAGKVIGKFIYLGFYDNETVWDKKQIERVQGIIASMKEGVGSGSFPVTYHRVSFSNGTVCDHTGKPRTTRVLIRCSLTSDDKLYEVIERETCSYTLIVYTALLCGHPLFDTRKKGRARTLSCSPLLSQTEYQKYLDEQEQEMDDEETHSEDTKQFSTATDVPPQSVPINPFVPKHSQFTGQWSPAKQDSSSPHSLLDKDMKVTKKEVKEPPAPPAGPLGSDLKSLLFGEIEKSIEDLYKQLVANLDEQKDSDPAASKLKESIVNKYTEFESLKKKTKRQKEIEEQLTDDEKNFRETKPPPIDLGALRNPGTQKKDSRMQNDNLRKLKEDPRRSKEDLAKQEGKGTDSGTKRRSSIQPYEVQGVNMEDMKTSSDKEGEVEIREEDEILTVERMTDIEEAINEQLRESGIDVKVVAMPLNIMEMLMEEDSEDEDNSEEGTVKMIVRLDNSQQSLSSQSQSLSQIVASLWGGPPEEPHVSPEQQRARELESSYEQVWGEQSESNKKRTS